MPRLELPAFTTIDLRVGVAATRLRTALFVKNVTDRHGYAGGMNLSNGPDGPWTAALITPRTVGLSLTMDL